MDVVRFQKIGRIPELAENYSLIARSVANDGSLLFLFVERGAERAVAATIRLDIGTFPQAKMEVPKRFYLVRAASGSTEAIELPALDVAHPQVDIFPDGRILLAGARCFLRGEGDFDLNGIIIDPRSGKSTRILLGDGISNAQVDDLGRIWVSYFDEGIVGNFGWGEPGSAPIGSAGLVCFSDSGEKIWEYPYQTHEPISDCYALNVSGSQAAIFFYTDFPVCRISSDFKLQYWATNLSGYGQLAISGTKVLLAGHPRAPDVAHLGTLDAGQLGKTEKVRLAMPDGSSLSKGQLLGRGSHLYFFDASDVYRLSLE